MLTLVKEGSIFMRRIIYIFAIALLILCAANPAHAATNGISADHSKGVVLLGSPAGAANCKAATTGAIRYNSVTSKVESCNGTIWAAVGGTVTPAGSDKQVQLNNNGALAASSGLTFNSTSDALTLGGTSGLAAPTGTTFAVLASDFTDASSAALQVITGLSFTLPASLAQNIPFECNLMYSQATGAVSDAFGIGFVGYNPTRIDAYGTMSTNTTVYTTGVLTNNTTGTTAVAIVTATPSAITTVWTARLAGTIQNASNAGTNTLNFYVSQGTAADLVKVRAGSWCKIW